MIRLNQLKLPVDHTREQLIHKTAQYLRIPAADILELQIVRQSLDARKKPALFYSYSVNVTVKKEEKVYKDACRRLGKANVLLTEKRNIFSCRRFNAAEASHCDHRNGSCWTFLRILSGTARLCTCHSGTGCRRGCQTGGCRSFLADGQIKAGFQCAVWRRRCRNFFGW